VVTSGIPDAIEILGHEMVTGQSYPYIIWSYGWFN
jgi:hypothetical protein